MKNTKYLLLLVVCFLATSFSSQAQDNSLSDDEKDRINRKLQQRGALRTLPKQKGNLQGNPYLYKDFQSGVVKFKGENVEYKVAQMRYNALYDYIEVKHKDKVQVIDGNKIDAMILNVAGRKKIFLSTRLYQIEGKPMRGFLQRLSRGSVQLMKRVDTYLKKATYNVALNVGDNFDKIIQNNEYYFLNKRNLYKVKSKKSIYKYFAKTGFNAKSYAKLHKLNLKEERAKRQLLAAYNVHLSKSLYQKK
jgi:hypothetical protein